VTESPISDVITKGIRVVAAAQYISEQSDPDRHHYQYVYRIVISNEGESNARLRARHWVILDADNERREVRGKGVVGETPELRPGDSFQYFSGCPLQTQWGTMEGTYEMEREDGSTFDAAIGRFFLAPTNPPVLPTEDA